MAESVNKTKAQIVIDARKLGDGGIGVYIENLVDGLVSLKNSGELVADFVLLCEPSLTEAWRKHWQGKVSVVSEISAKYSLSEYFFMPLRQKKLLSESHLYHSPHYTLPFGLGVPAVVTVHDIIHVSHPQSFSHKHIGKALIASAVKRAALVLTVSNYSAERIKEFFQCETQIAVTANAAQSDIKSIDISAHKKQQSYCLFVGNSKPHKGLDMLIESWKILDEKLGSQLPDLVIVSKQVTESQKLAIARSSKTMLLKDCSVSELSRFYNLADALLIPSTEEGFGLPVLEAFLCETAVVSTPLESVKEYFNESVWYSENYTAKSFAAAVAKMLFSGEQGRIKIEQGHAIALGFSKEKMARATADCYVNVLHSFHGENAPRVFAELGKDMERAVGA